MIIVSRFHRRVRMKMNNKISFYFEKRQLKTYLMNIPTIVERNSILWLKRQVSILQLHRTLMDQMAMRKKVIERGFLQIIFLKTDFYKIHIYYIFYIDHNSFFLSFRSFREFFLQKQRFIDLKKLLF